MTRKATAHKHLLRACLRDLVALSVTPTWWVGRPVAAIMDGLRDMLCQMLRADAAYIRVRDTLSGAQFVSVIGASAEAMERALQSESSGPVEQASGERMRLASCPVGIESEQGDIVVGSTRPGFPGQLDSLLITVAASQLAIALQHAALLRHHEEQERQLEARATQQGTVARLGVDALSGPPLEVLLDEVVDLVSSTLHVDYTHVLQVDGDGGLVVVAGAGWQDIGSGRMQSKLASQAGQTLQNETPVIVPGRVRRGRPGASPVLRRSGIRCALTVPVPGQSGPWGVLGVYGRARRAFSSDDVNFLRSVANLIAAAIQRLQGEAERERLLERAEEARQAAEEAGRSKAAFLAMMSHELRTPLGAISGYIDLLEMEISGPINEDQRQYLGRLRHCQTYLLNLINNVLSFMRLGSGHVRYDLSSFDVAESIGAVEDLILPQIEARQIHYSREGPPGMRVRADLDKVHQILLNLLANGVKFTEPGGSLIIEWSDEAGKARISVRDTGCGIPADQIQNVFDAYVRVEGGGAGNKAEGTGLGLAISREFARGMGGDIRVASRAGEGSIFTVTLPLDV